ncbi:MAG: histidine kinase, partial [Actinomycetota bacterium]
MTSDIAAEAVHDLRQLTAIIRRLSGVLESAVLTQRAAMEARRLLGIHYTSVAILESPRELIMRGSAGARTEELRKLKIPLGAGVGGKVLVLRKPVSVADYEHDPSISREFVDLAVHREGLRGVTGVPIEYEDQTLGVLYAGMRDVGYMGDRGRLLLMETARSLGPLVVAANQAEEGVRQRLQEDRQRLGLELHDNLGQLLFGIGASARRAREQISAEAEDLAAELKDIEAQASRAASCLRDALRALA